MRRSLLAYSTFLPALALLILIGQEKAGAAEPDFAHFADRYIGVTRTVNPTPMAEIRDMLADDFVQSTSLGTVVKGKAANLDLYRKSLGDIKTLFSQLDAKINVHSIRRFPEVAILFGKITMSGKLKQGNAPFQREVWETIVFKKQGERWLMIHEQSTVARKPAPTR